MGRRLTSLVGLALMVLCAAAANATMVMPSSLEQMVAGSDTIAVGRVTSKTCFADGGKIFTGVTISVTEYLKSYDPDKPAALTLKLLGGTLGTRSMNVDLSPTFQTGEEVLLFLKRADDNYVTYGFYYGVCRITASQDGLTSMVSGPVYSTGQVYDFVNKTMVLNDLPIGGEPLGACKARILNALALGQGR